MSYKSIQNALNDKKTPDTPPVTDKVDSDVDNVKETESKKDDVTEEKTQQPEEETQPPVEEKQPVVETKAYVRPVSGEIMVGFSLETRCIPQHSRIGVFTTVLI